MPGDTFNGPTGYQSGDHNVQHNHFHQAPATPVTWPVRVGTVPPRASAYQPRPPVRERIERARAGSATAVLAQVLAGGGGTGKSQLAADYAHRALADGTDLVVWIPAAETDRIVALYAQAAHQVRAPGALGENAETDAAAFLAWLAVTPRSWLVVLDDITRPEAMGPWWPPPAAGGAGRVLVTTRRRDAVLTGNGRVLVDVDTYTKAEAAAYLRERLTEAGYAALLDDARDALAEALGRLPLALSHAAAYLINEAVPCARYLELFAARDARLDGLLPPDADTDGYGHGVATALLLSLDAARHSDETGLADAALRLAAVLDPAGHPRSVWLTPAVRGYLGRHRVGDAGVGGGGTVGPADVGSADVGAGAAGTGEVGAADVGSGAAGTGDVGSAEVGDEEAGAVLRVLHRYGLLTDAPTPGPRSVTLHALTARATHEITPAEQRAEIHRTAADALLALWPEHDHTDYPLAAALRSSSATLAARTGDDLWDPGAHRLLCRAGDSLSDTGLYTAAVTYWEALADQFEHRLGPGHPDTLTARNDLAAAYWRAGRTNKAITLLEQVTADRERLLGPEHHDTLTTRDNLAVSYAQASRTGDAVNLLEHLAADRERVFGPEHPGLLITRRNLATAYARAGRIGEAITLLEQVTADSERVFGPEDTHTLTTRNNLATAYAQAGRTSDAVTLLERLTADRERVFGPEHPHTLTSRNNLAASYSQAGRIDEAIDLLEHVTEHRVRLLGPGHPDTLTARDNLGTAYSKAGRADEAITLLEQVVADRVRLLGPEHHDNLTTRDNLAIAYSKAGRIDDAVNLLEHVAADSERLLGPEHPGTLTTRNNLATAYWDAGRVDDAIALLEQVTADRERLLGPQHPHTLTARDNLAIAKSQTNDRSGKRRSRRGWWRRG